MRLSGSLRHLQSLSRALRTIRWMDGWNEPVFQTSNQLSAVSKPVGAHFPSSLLLPPPLPLGW